MQEEEEEEEEDKRGERRYLSTPPQLKAVSLDAAALRFARLLTCCCAAFRPRWCYGRAAAQLVEAQLAHQVLVVLAAKSLGIGVAGVFFAWHLVDEEVSSS